MASRDIPFMEITNKDIYKLVKKNNDNILQMKEEILKHMAEEEGRLTKLEQIARWHQGIAVFFITGISSVLWYLITLVR